MTFYHLIYYKIYVTIELFNKWLRNDIIEYSAMFFQTMLIIFNFFTILSIFDLLTHNFTNIDPLLVKFGTGLIMVINYFVFIQKKRYLNVIKHFKKKYKSEQDFIVIGYIIFSIWSLFYFGGKHADINKAKEINHDAWYNKIELNK